MPFPKLTKLCCFTSHGSHIASLTHTGCLAYWLFWSTSCPSSDGTLTFWLISFDLSAAFDTIDHIVLLSPQKPASAYLDSPLHGSTPILKGVVNLSVLAVPYLQLLCVPREFHKDMCLVLCFFPYSSHPLHILSVHMASCSSSTLTTLRSMSPYPKIITILQVLNSSFVSRPSIPGSAITG